MIEQKATLQIALVEKIYAYQLYGIVFLIDDLYTSYSWLDRADYHSGSKPYGDGDFIEEHFLVIKKLEIGTPNIVEFYGLIEPLKAALVYLGGVGGIVSLLESGSAAFKNWKEAMAIKDKKNEEYRKSGENSKVDTPTGYSIIDKREAHINELKIQTENLMLKLQIEQQKILGQFKKSPYEKAYELYLQGKVSKEALDFKDFSQSNISLQIDKNVLDIAIHISLIPD